MEKSKEHLDRRKDKARKALRRYYLTHKPTDNSAHLRPYCFKPGNDPRQLDGYADGFSRGQAKRNQTIREEKARIAFGLPQRTKMRLIHQPRPKIDQRHYLKRLGYIIDEQDNIAYYTDTTKRAVRMEAGGKKKSYFKFKRYEQPSEQQ